MVHLRHSLWIFLTLLWLAACPGGSGVGPGLGQLPPGGPPGEPKPCLDPLGNCGIVPEPPQPEPPKPPVTLAISFPDFPGKTEFSATPGSAFTLTVAAVGAETATVSCTPAANPSLTPSYPGAHLFFLGAMPNEDLSCVITATQADKNTTATIVIHPTGGGKPLPLEVRNLPTLVAINAGTTKTVKDFYIQGFDATTTVAIACQSGPSAQLIPNAAKTSWYDASITALPSPATTDSCTVTTTRKSDAQTATATFKALYEAGPQITPTNFKAGAPLYLVALQGYFASVDSGGKITLPKIEVYNESGALAVSVNCTDTHGATLMTHNANLQQFATAGVFPYTLTLGYIQMGEPGSTDICSVKAIGGDGAVSILDIPVVHAATPFQQALKNLPAGPIQTTGKPMKIENITAEPFDAATQLHIQCQRDTAAKLVATGATTFSATIEAPLTLFPAADHCVVVALHNGIQTSAASLTIQSVPAQFTPKNYEETGNLYMKKAEVGEVYLAYNNVAFDNFPALTIEDPDGIAVTQLSCISTAPDAFDAVASGVKPFLIGNDYYLYIRYKAASPAGSLDACTIQVVDSAGQLSYHMVTLNW